MVGFEKGSVVRFVFRMYKGSLKRFFKEGLYEGSAVLLEFTRP